MQHLIFLCLSLALVFGDQIQITPNSGSTADQQALAQALFPPGVAVVDVNSITLTGQAKQSGFFDKGTEALGIESGILLTTSSANDANGPNNHVSSISNSNTAQDADLTSIGVTGIQDQNSLTFSFTSTGAPLSFRYVFGSEEYPVYVGSQYNDAFAFFLDGVNVATLPGTNVPVRINNVNAGLNADYFKDNSIANTASYNQIQFNGLTKNLFVSLCLTAGVHTFKFIVADVSDGIYDSGVFLETATTYHWTTDPANAVLDTTLELPCGSPLPTAPNVYVSSACNDLQKIELVETHPDANTVVIMDLPSRN